MILSQEEKQLIVECLLSVASLDIIYEGQEDPYPLISIANKIKDSTDNLTLSLRAVVDESNNGVFDKTTSIILDSFPEIKKEVFIP